MSFKDLHIVNELLPTLTKSELRLIKRLIQVVYNNPVSDRIENLLENLNSKDSKDNLENEHFKSNSLRRKRAEEYKRLSSVIKYGVLLHLLHGDKDIYSSLFLNKFQIRLLTTYAEIIKSKGAISSTVKILDNCEKIAKEFQLYDQIIDILYIKSDLGFNGSMYYDFEKIVNEITHYENCRKRVKQSKIIYRDYFSKAVKKGIFKGDKNALKTSIKKLERFYSETKSNLILLKYYLFKMEYFLVCEKYNQGSKIGLDAIELLENDIGVRTSTRIGYFHFNIAETELGALRFERSLYHALKAESFINKNSLNRLISSQYIVLSCIYTNNIKEAIRELERIKDLKIFQSYPFYKSKFSYYQAVIQFLEEDYEKAWQAFSLHFDLEQDKEGWRVWLSIMRLLCQIERGELVDVDLMVQTFRKYIKSWEERSEIREREKLVFKVIETLNKSHFDYNKTKELEADTLTLLRSKVKELKWRPNSPELIIFHDWFDSKCENRPYKPNYKPYKTNTKAVN